MSSNRRHKFKSNPAIVESPNVEKINVLCYGKKLIHLVFANHDHKYVRVREKTISDSKAPEYLNKIPQKEIIVTVIPAKLDEIKEKMKELATKNNQNIISAEEAFNATWAMLSTLSTIRKS